VLLRDYEREVGEEKGEKAKKEPRKAIVLKWNCFGNFPEKARIG
jgi:hypothetical protein